ncbi:hypothetical protein [Streptomyces atratus]|uniref:Uncharacterized protein n=1 Tax=Streptomyces atratus TaxID=1893 RepID=A0A2Z5J6J5_STRAR|nr:hypothetical protein [Streptomyces atratus]AXE75952.1 hypothetical protein C5746_01990 [Streptomyces atratus]
MTVRRWGRPRGGLPFETAERRLAEDFLLALGTDGLLQAPDPDADAGPDLLPRTGAGPARPLEQLCGAVPTTLLSGPVPVTRPCSLPAPALRRQDGPSGGAVPVGDPFAVPVPAM